MTALNHRRPHTPGTLLPVLGALLALTIGWSPIAHAEDTGADTDNPASADTSGDTAVEQDTDTTDGGIVWRDRLDQKDETADRAATAGGGQPDGPTRGAPPTPDISLPSMLGEMILVLGIVCLLAYAVLRWGLGNLLGRSTDDEGPIDIIAREAVGPKRAILVVRIGRRTLIVGDSESGMTRLGELDADETDDLVASMSTEERSTPSFQSFLQFGGDDKADD